MLSAWLFSFIFPSWSDTQNDKGSVNESAMAGTSYMGALTLFSSKYVFKIIVLKQAIKNSSKQSKTEFFDFEVPYTTHL